MMANIDSEQLGGMSDEHKAEALETTGADHLGAGAANFDEIQAAATFLDQAPVETPESFARMTQGEEAAGFFSSMFGVGG